jgi:hypothetical protein
MKLFFAAACFIIIKTAPANYGKIINNYTP